MTNLLEKIAAVVARELVRQAQNCGEYQNRNCYEVADAVIRELQLHEENGWFGPTNIPKHRYVTEWVADE